MLTAQTLSFQKYTPQAPATVFLPLARPPQRHAGMRELTLDEIDCVSGGIYWLGVAHTAYLTACGMVGGALCAEGGPVGAIAGGVAGAAAGDMLWQAVMG